jgi:protein zwilch
LGGFCFFKICFFWCLFLSEKPQKWKVEISSGQKKVKTVWQLSDISPVDHLDFHRPGL